MNGRLEEVSDAGANGHDEVGRTTATNDTRNGSTPSRWSTRRPSSCSRVHITFDRKPR